MKRLFILLFTWVFFVLMSMTSFAGEWKQDTAGWQYRNDDGSYVKDNWLTLNDDAKYHFDQNGYMQTGLVEVEGIKHYFDNSGRMVYNCDTSEGYKIDVDGRVIDENAPGVNFTILWLTDPNKNTSSTVVCDFVNEGKQAFTVDPIVEVNTDGVVKQFHMVDINTMTPCEYGVISANTKQDHYFAFASKGLQQFTFNDNTTLNFTISCASFSNSYYRIIQSKTQYRFYIEESGRQ